MDDYKIRRAMGVLLDRLQTPGQPGLYDVEACWTIGVLASVLNIADNELAAMGVPHSTVKFEECGNKKIPVIKLIRERFSYYQDDGDIGLKKAKELAEGRFSLTLPSVAADALKAECESLSYGCRVTVTPERGASSSD